MATNPLKIGITGGIGSGKTLVSTIFSLLGIPVYDADTRAKWIVNHHTDVKKEIVDFFGAESYVDKKLNTRYIAEKVFGDNVNTEKINSIVHPRVGEDFANWLVEHKDYPYILKEAAILFESNSHKQLDKVIVVTAPIELRIKRIVLRDPQRSEQEIRAIMDKQMPEEQKLKMADFIIHNDGKQLIIPQVVELDKKFRTMIQ